MICPPYRSQKIQNEKTLWSPIKDRLVRILAEGIIKRRRLRGQLRIRKDLYGLAQ